MSEREQKEADRQKEELKTGKDGLSFSFLSSLCVLYNHHVSNLYTRCDLMSYCGPSFFLSFFSYYLPISCNGREH